MNVSGRRGGPSKLPFPMAKLCKTTQDGNNVLLRQAVAQRLLAPRANDHHTVLPTQSAFSGLAGASLFMMGSMTSSEIKSATAAASACLASELATVWQRFAINCKPVPFTNAKVSGTNVLTSGVQPALNQDVALATPLRAMILVVAQRSRMALRRVYSGDAPQAPQRCHVWKLDNDQAMWKVWLNGSGPPDRLLFWPTKLTGRWCVPTAANSWTVHRRAPFMQIIKIMETALEKRRLGRTNLTTAPLVLGGNVFGWTADEKTSFALLTASPKQGSMRSTPPTSIRTGLPATRAANWRRSSASG